MTTAEVRNLPGYANQFVGRDWVLSRIGDWLAGTGTNSLLVTGPPGSGKSAIAAHLVELSARSAEDASPVFAFPRGFVTYHHFCRARDGRSRNPLRFLEGLAAGLAVKTEGFGQYLMKHAAPGITIESSINIERAESNAQITGVSIGALHVGALLPRLAFDQMIARPLEELGVNRPVVVIVDALDEATDESDNSFIDLIEHMLNYRETLPLRFILTVRANVVAVVDRLEAETIHITEDEPPGADDIRLYALDLLSDPTHPGHPYRERLASRISSASNGNFLYAEFQLAALRDHPERWQATELPEGLHDAYRSFLQREVAPSRTGQQWTHRYRPILGLIAVARGDGITPAHLQAITGLPASEVEDSLVVCGAFLKIREGSPEIRLYHESFREFLIRNATYRVYPDEAVDSLVGYCMTALAEQHGVTTDEYTLRHLVEHLQELRRYGDVVSLSLNEAFLRSQDTLAPWHEFSLATQDAGIRAALMAQDAEHFTAIAVASGLTRDRITKITPLEALADDGLASALRIARAMGPDDRTMWYLALAVCPGALPSAVEPSTVLGELISLELSILPQHWQDTAAALLARAVAVDCISALRLQAVLLNDWGRQHLVNLLIDAGDLDHSALSHAPAASPRFSDSDIWLRAVHAIAEEHFRLGRIDEAIAKFARIIQSVPWVSQYLSIYDETEPEFLAIPDEGVDEFLASIYAGVPEAKSKLFQALATDAAQVSRASLMIAARAAYYYHHIGDHVAADMCLSFCIDKTTKVVASPSSREEEQTDVSNRQSQAWAWLYLSETFFYLHRLPEARRFLRRAAEIKPPLSAMLRQLGYSSAIHDDPQHRFCPQGLTLRLSQAGARLGEPEIHHAAAKELMDLKSRDAVRAMLSDIEASADDQPRLREKFAAALSWTNAFATGRLRAVELQRLTHSPVVSALPEKARAASTADSLLLDVLRQSRPHDAALVPFACMALATAAVTLGRNGLHNKSTQVIRRLRSWVARLNNEWLLTELVRHLAERGTATQILELLDGLDARSLGLYENVWESQFGTLVDRTGIDAFVARTGDIEGAERILKAIKPDGIFPALSHVKDLVTGSPMNIEEVTKESAQLLWLASRVAARVGDNERADMLSQYASAAAAKLVEAHHGLKAESSQEPVRHAEILARAARQLAEMGLVERAEEAFSLAASYRRESWNVFRFVIAGVVQTHDKEVNDEDTAIVFRIIHRCDYVEGFAHSGRFEMVQAHVEAVMNDAYHLKTVDGKDKALRRIARMLGYFGRLPEARDAVDSMHDNREYAAVRVLESVIATPSATGIRLTAGTSEDLMDIIHLGCRSLNGTILTCAALSDGLFPFDAAVAESLDALIAAVTERVNAIIDASA
jgi:tetratricopeptide (TPR) repeat protein